MDTYYIVVIIMILSFFYFNKKKKNLASKIGTTRKVNANEAFFYFFLIFLVFACRHQSMGYDLDYRSSTGYLGWFETFTNADFSDLLKLSLLSGYDYGFVLLNKIIGLICPDRQFYIAVCAAISILPYKNIIRWRSPYILLSVAIFIGLPSFLYLYGTLRQVVAMGILTYSIDSLEKKQIKKFLFFVSIAFLIHASSIVFLLAYPLYHLRMNMLKRYISFAILAAIYSVRVVVLPLVLPYISVGTYFMEKTSSSKSFFAYSAIYVISSFFISGKPQNAIESIRANGYLNLYFMACFCLSFQDVTPVAARLAAFFMFGLMISAPIQIHEIKNHGLRNIILLSAILFFLVIGLMRIQAGGEDFAMSYPYIYFWENP